MNVLEKISGIEICPDTRISEQDRQFCIINQNAYDTAKADLDCIRKQWDTLVKNQEDILSASTESDYEKYRFIWINGFSSRDIKKKIEILPKIFIETIVNYFNNRYHVSINSDEVKRIFIPKEPEWSWEKRITEEYHKTMLELSLHYEDILEQIFVQLGGRTFEERAVAELKEKCHQFAWNSYSNIKEFEIKNDTIQFNGYACSYDNWIGKLKWKIEDGMKDILRGVSHFETELLESYPNGISDLLGRDDKETSTYEFSLIKVKRIRIVHGV